ncbi:MAG: trypsin-like serine protease [Minicystis sp.]
MRISLPWIAAFCAAALAAQACGGGSNETTGGGGSTSSSGSGGDIGTGGGSSSSSSGSTGGGGGAAAGPFTSKGTSSYEAQTSLAADSKGNLVAGWIAFFTDGTSAIGYAVSHDGGNGWTAPRYISSPGGRLASNPVLAADGQGRVYLAWLGFRVDAVNPDEHVYLSRLDAATDTFATPVVASDDGNGTALDFDKPSIAVDANDNVLLTWADFTGSGMGTPPSLTFARSADGTTFTRSTITADATFGNLASLCLDRGLGPSAPLYLVHLGAGGTVTLRRSGDQGKNWQILSVPATNVVFQDINCAAYGPQLWISYASGTAVFSPSQDSPGDAVSLIHSGNGGDGFEAPITVSNGPSGSQYLFPKLVFDPAGDLHVAYYEGTVGSPASLQLATSANGGPWGVKLLGPAGTFTIDSYAGELARRLHGLRRLGRGPLRLVHGELGGQGPHRPREGPRAVRLRALPVLLALGLPACAEPVEEASAAIIGGTPTTGDPAVVMLVSHPPDASTFDACTASLIAKDVLLTAAHCVDPATHPGYVFGAFTGPDASAYPTAALLAPELVAAKETHLHPDYDPSAPFHADLGVVVLAAPLDVAPLPINRAPLDPSIVGAPARIVGYGQLTYSEINEIKHEATTVVAAIDPGDTIIVGDGTHRSCVGDSGGPVLVKVGGVETILGVDSYTDTKGCLEPAHYRRTDLYTAFLDAYAPPPPPVADAGSDGGDPDSAGFERLLHPRAPRGRRRAHPPRGAPGRGLRAASHARLITIATSRRGAALPACRPSPRLARPHCDSTQWLSPPPPRGPPLPPCPCVCAAGAASVCGCVSSVLHTATASVSCCAVSAGSTAAPFASRNHDDVSTVMLSATGVLTSTVTSPSVPCSARKWPANL